MAEHNDRGKEGERMACLYLQGKGWKILEQNWRSGHKEIDIIAETGGELVVVEVKVRKSVGGERIEEHIPRNKQRHLVRAAGSYLACRKLDLNVRFDVVLLTGEKGNYRLEHIEDAFSHWD